MSDAVARVAATKATVLIEGESGTGKELIAHAIHDASLRADRPFVSIDCASITPTLVESELFGFEQGSFTGADQAKPGRIESAHRGTLFLDEIGDMPLEAQCRLLRVIQEREITRIGARSPIAVDVRIIAATHRNLGERAARGEFRSDLWYRLNVVPITVPPLRERKDDIPALFEHFLEKHCARMGGTRPIVQDALWDSMTSYAWPGNIRELENFVERSVAIGRFDLAVLGRRLGPSLVPCEPPITLAQAVKEAERSAIARALRAAGGNKSVAARILGVSYKTLFNKMRGAVG